MQHSKGITVGTYTVKTKKKVNNMPICPTCKKCKDRKICSNMKKLSKCHICKNCANAEQCDIFYITTCSKAILNLGRSPQTGKEIKKTFTGKTEDEALYKLYQFKDDVKKNGLPRNIVEKSVVTIYSLGMQMEDIKKSRGKIGTNAYRTNMSTLKRLANYDFANIPIESEYNEWIANASRQNGDLFKGKTRVVPSRILTQESMEEQKEPLFLDSIEAQQKRQERAIEESKENQDIGE